MRRGLLIVAVVVLVATVALWIAATLERSPLSRSHGVKRVPDVVAGRDLGPVDAPAAVRAADGMATVRCSYDGEGDPGKLAAIGEEVVEGNSGGADLSLSVPAGTWSIVWMVESEERYRTFALGSLTAEAGAVYTCSLGDTGWEIRGTVRNTEGQPVAGVDVWACKRMVQSGEDGTFRGGGTGPECTVWARYRDGLLSRDSARVTVSPFDARAIELVVDDAPIAGMGLAFRVTDEGVRVLTVHPDTPAEEAGVEEGDLIVSVNGTPTAGLDESAFIALGTGREGSRVELVLEHDGERDTVSFLRERLPETEEELEELGTIP